MARILFGLLALALFASPPSASASEHLGDRDVSFLSLQVNARGEALVSYRKASGERRDVARLGRRERARAGPAAAAGALSVRLQRRLAVARHRAVRRARSGTRARRTTVRGSSFSSPPARRPTARTGRCSAGSGSRRCAASIRSSPSRRRSSSMSRTGRGRCRCSRSHRTGRTAAPAGLVRPPHLPRRGRARVPDTVSDETRPVRPLRLHRHLQLASTAPAGSATPASSRTSETGPSVTASSRRSPPPGYPSSEPRGPGNGERHRVTVMGPGVTPVVRWEGEGTAPLRRRVGSGVQQASSTGWSVPRTSVCAPER